MSDKPSKPDAAHAAKSHEAAKHAAASHIAGVGGRSPVVPVIVGVLVLGGISVGLYFANKKGAETHIDRSFSAPEARTMSAKVGERGSMKLGEDIRITLGSESKVIVPPIYAADLRAVKLEGTAVFTVNPGGASPFRVRAGANWINATGTEFSVRAFGDEDAVIVSVKEGQVEVAGEKETRALSAGGAISVAKDGTMQEPAPDALARAFSWTEGKFMIENRPLRETLPQLKRWYALSLDVKDQALLDRPVTMNTSLEGTKEAIAALEKSAKVKFVYEGLKPVLRDASKK